MTNIMIAKLTAVVFLPMASAAIAGEIAVETAVSLVLLLLSAICFFLCSPTQGMGRFLQAYHPVEIGALDFMVSLTLSWLLLVQDCKATFIILAAYPGFYKFVLPWILNWGITSAREHAEANEEEEEGILRPYIIDDFGLLDFMIAAVVSILVQFQGEEHRTAVRLALALIPSVYKIILPSIFNFAMGMLVRAEVQP